MVAGVLAVGLASAQTSTPEPTATGSPENLADRFKEELASQLGISVDELNTALDDTQFALIDQAVADGKLTESEAEKLKARVEEGHNLFPLHGVRDRIEHRLKVGLVEATAAVLGVDVAVVKEGVQNGDTLAEIANANGMDTDEFKTALLAQVKSTLDTKVADGGITQEQADNLYERLSTNIDDIVNHEPGEYDRPHFPGRGPGGPRFRFNGPDANGSGSASPPDDVAPKIF
jgi:polyhydroxyalkanoate synthesis regulator phasin